MHIIKYGDPLYMQELGLYSYNVLCTLYMATLINKPLAKFCYVQEWTPNMSLAVTWEMGIW